MLWKRVLIAAVLLVPGAVVLGLGLLYLYGDIKNPVLWAQHQLTILSVKGGPEFVLEVDADDLWRRKHELLRQDAINLLRSRRLSVNARLSDVGVEVSAKPEDRQIVLSELQGRFGSASPVDIKASDDGVIRMSLTETGLAESARLAAGQSAQGIRGRLSDLGVRVIVAAHPQPGRAGMLVQVPRSAELQRVIEIATKPGELGLRLIDNTMTPEQALASGVPRGSEILHGPQDSGKQAYLVERRVMVSGADLADAQPALDQRTDEPVVTFRLSSAGTRKFAQATAENVGRPMAIVIDNEVVSAPVIREPIMGGSGQISGNFTAQAAHDLAVLLRSGGLPARLKVVEVRAAKSP